MTLCKGPSTSSVTQSRAEVRGLFQLGSVFVYVPTITGLLSERVREKSQSSVEAARLRADDKRSTHFLGKESV